MPGCDPRRPCYECPDRHEACWGHCEAYKAYAEELRKSRTFVMNANRVREFPPTVKYKKSSGRYIAPKSAAHKHR